MWESRLENIEFIEALYKKYYRKVLAFYNIYCDDKNDAEDCLQKTFIEAMEKIRILKVHANPEKWLYKTSYNFIRNANKIKRRYVNRVENFDDLENIIYNNDFQDELIDKIDNDEKNYNDYIKTILSQLSEKQKNLFICKYLKKMEINEIAKNNNRSYASITTAIYNLKKRLKEILEYNINNR